MYKLQVYLASLQFAVRKTETSAYRGIRLKISNCVRHHNTQNIYTVDTTFDKL